MVEQANAVAEVDVVTRLDGQSAVHINKWLKKITIKADKGDFEQDTSYLLISGSDEELKLLSSGKHYIVFMVVAEADPYDIDYCKRFTGTMGLAVGAQGIFELANGLIGKAGLAAYSGKPVSLLETDILSASPGGVSIVPAPDTGPADLVRLAQSADMIAEVNLVEADAGVGNYFGTYEVLHWLKKPMPTLSNSINLRMGHCASVLNGSSHRHYIMFVNRITSEYEDRGTLVSETLTSLAGGDQGLYWVSDDGNSIGWAGISHYDGWTTHDFEDEIQKALSIPGTPDPKLRPPDTGTPQP